MTRAVYLGGYGNGRSAAELVGEALSPHYDGHVETFTFSDWRRNPEKIQRAASRADLLMHSAGALALADRATYPRRAYMLNPPLPNRIGDILFRTLTKTIRMHRPGVGIHSLRDAAAVAFYDASAAAELAVHPLLHARSLPDISKYHALEVASVARARGIDAQVVWTVDDAYFQPTAQDFAYAHEHEVPVHIIPGEHDEVVLRSRAHVESVFEKVV